MAYTLVFNLIFKLDLLMLKPAAFATLGAGESDRLMGIYNLALQVSRLPWQVTIAVTFVIFPLLSEATFAQDEEKSRTYIRQTLRYLLILVGAACAGLFALPQTVTSLFPASYGEMTTALIWTAPAYLCFTLFNMCNTLLMSAGRATSAFVIGVSSVSLAAFLYSLTLYSGLIEGPLTVVEYITTAGQVAFVTFTAGLCMCLFRLTQLFGSPLPLGTVLRTLGAGTIIWLIGQQVTTSVTLYLLLSLIMLGLLFLIIIYVSGEWTAEEKAMVKARFTRKRESR